MNPITIDLIRSVRSDEEARSFLVQHCQVTSDSLSWRSLLYSIMGYKKNSGLSSMLNKYLNWCGGHNCVQAAIDGSPKDYQVSLGFACRCIIYFIRKNLIYGVGVNDYAGVVKENGVLMPAYHCWCHLLERCYDEKALNKRPGYRDVYVADEWLQFTQFKAWYDSNYRDGYVLDKDIIIRKNRIYSPDACAFVPVHINNIILDTKAARGNCPIGITFRKDVNKYSARVTQYGKRVYLGHFESQLDAFAAYKKEKEQHVKDVAYDYYSKGMIGKRVYDALLTFEVMIDD
jgi:hypothetical protein